MTLLPPQSSLGLAWCGYDGSGIVEDDCSGTPSYDRMNLLLFLKAGSLIAALEQSEFGLDGLDLISVASRERLLSNNVSNRFKILGRAFPIEQ